MNDPHTQASGNDEPHNKADLLSRNRQSRLRKLSAAADVGEGGMGACRGRADRADPAIVALKLIKLGMDTREVVARFEAERQAWR